MNEIHEGLADMDFETSATVQEATICTKTGLLARSSCPSITEYFAVSDLPTERCKGPLHRAGLNTDADQNPFRSINSADNPDTDGGTAGNSGSDRNTCRSAF